MIEVTGLTKRFGDVTAVDDLTFTVRPGKVTGFLGPNGAGKSTTMRMILGLDRPTRGQATVNGKPYTTLKNPLTTVGSLLDANSRHPNRSARNRLKWIAQSNGIAVKRVDEVLHLVGLTEVGKKKAGGFSLGMGQRLGLAAALLGDPEILILDEPVNGLDPEGIVWVRTLLKTLAAEGRTVFVSSHLLSEMAHTADHLIVIGRGKLIADAPVNEFIKHSAKSSAHVRTPEPLALTEALNGQNISFTAEKDPEGREVFVIPGATTDRIGQLAHTNSIPLAELTEHTASLEQAFMESTGDKAQYQAAFTGMKDMPAVEEDKQ
ncbi:ABC transporter ATP-binding protein [Corynebacterium mendelii]|uniref:ABC transporter ATP-binding protein n=1 Tax=Corynebacterium mendelii TaxID=2765362 RepID=A0A939IYY1_9CORY|nr:ABC transporter ATP-binding protein [Corynebacterium mendelii]MBN9645142.1 ABC transporter ATP-binding protein [Corynebacterium mendelii]